MGVVLRLPYGVEAGGDGARRRVGHDGDAARRIASGEDETDAAGGGLLVVTHDRDDRLVVGEPRKSGRQADAARTQHTLDSIAEARGAEPEVLSAPGRGDEAQSDGLAVLEVERWMSLQRVRERVTEVEGHPAAAWVAAGLSFVGRDDRGFDGDVPRDKVDERGEVELQDSRKGLLDPIEEPGISPVRREQAVLDALGQAAAQFALREGAEGADICNDQGGLVERADDVLADARVIVPT